MNATVRASTLALALLLAATSCKIFDRTTQPIRRLYKQGSCIAIDLPPITLTPERTAAERQLIGEDRELEKNGWLIASARSTGPAGSASVPGGDPTGALRRYYEEVGVLEFYEDLVREYRAGGMLGEGRDGRLHVVPGNRRQRPERFQSPEEERRARVVATEVNRARGWIRAYRARQPDAIRDIPLKTDTRKGEYYQDERGRWVRR